MLSEDTGQLPAFVPKYVSSHVFRKIDEEYGKALVDNDGHLEITLHFEGERKPRWWEIHKRFLEYKKRIIN